MQPRTQGLKEKKARKNFSCLLSSKRLDLAYQVTDKPFIKTGPRYRQ